LLWFICFAGYNIFVSHSLVHSGTEHWVEFTTLNYLRVLRKGFWQPRQGNTVEITQALWSSGKSHQLNKEDIGENVMQSNTRKPVFDQPFEITTGVRQSCLLSPFLFLLAVNWIRRTTEGWRDGVQWSETRQLEDLDFADDLWTLSHSQAQMQEKTKALNIISQQVELQIHSEKKKRL
jgi:hypothetical protein